jgi:heme transport system substrate-binding protein
VRRAGPGIALVALAALALGAAPAAPKTDMRVATLVPSVEQALSDLEGVSIVAGVRSSFRAPERTDVIDLGSPHHPNVERLADSHADLVVGDVLISGPLRSELGRFGAEVILLDTTTVEGTLGGLGDLGRRVGAGEEVAARVQTAREGIAAQSLDQPVPVLALFGTPGSFQVMTGKTWIGSLLEEMGFENLGAGLTGHESVPGFVEVSHEHLAGLRPQLVLFVAHGDPRRLQHELEQQLSGTGPLGALGRNASLGVHLLSPELFVANPGLELPRAARELAELARGEGTGTR